MLDGLGEPPQRAYTRFRMHPVRGLPLAPMYDREEFPEKVDLEESFDIPVSLFVLPDPEIAKLLLPKEIRKTILGGQDVDRRSRSYSKFVSTIFYTPIGPANGQSLPTPKGYRNYWGGRMVFGKWLVAGKTLGDLEGFPESFESNERLLGILTSAKVCKGNDDVNFVFFKDCNGNEKHWIGYHIIDANGGMRLVPPDGAYLVAPRTKTITSFLRPMVAPYAPEIVDPTGKIRPQNLLLTQTNEPTASGDVVSEEWMMPEQYYSEKPVPVWGLWATAGSEPWRENFSLSHAFKEGEGELWKVFIFPNVKPKELLISLARYKKVSLKLLPSDDEIEASLGSYFRRAQQTRSRYLKLIE